MAVECRRGVASDRPTLEIIRRQAIESAFSDQYERNRFADRVATPDPNLAQWLEDDQFVVCVLETTVTPVAYGVASLDSGRIAAVYTSPDYQHRGYGTRVVDCLGTHLTTAGHAQMDVDAPEAAVPFFRTIGFECRGQASIDGPIPHMRLTKSLADTTSG